MKKAGKIQRSRDAYIGGVCAGAANHFDIEPILTRVFAVLFAVTTLGLGVLVYALLWIALPLEPQKSELLEVKAERVESSNYKNIDASNARGITSGELSSVSREEVMNTPLRFVVAIAIVLLFVIVSNSLAPFVRGTSWWQYWPLVIIIAGFALIVMPIARERTAFWHLAGVALIASGWSAVPIALELFSPLTLMNACFGMWPILLISVGLFIVGVWHSETSFALCAVILFVFFCIVMVTQFAVPGSMDDIVLLLPDGSTRLVLRGPHL